MASYKYSYKYFVSFPVTWETDVVKLIFSNINKYLKTDLIKMMKNRS